MQADNPGILGQTPEKIADNSRSTKPDKFFFMVKEDTPSFRSS